MFLGYLMELVARMLIGCLLATGFLTVFSVAYYGARARRIRGRTSSRTRTRRTRTGVRSR